MPIQDAVCPEGVWFCVVGGRKDRLLHPFSFHFVLGDPKLGWDLAIFCLVSNGNLGCVNTNGMKTGVIRGKPLSVSPHASKGTSTYGCDGKLANCYLELAVSESEFSTVQVQYPR